MHVVTTCFGLTYLVMFVTTWLSFKTKPGIDHTVLFWAGYAVIGLMQAWIAVFLVRELYRQAMLYRGK